ncbi:hypothetical protein ACFVYA_13325 [Amycolatopsis sp. NPDC058278]|uniref:hypothetical protein n=1 Tax=Amycolatopsis sp. NPDC058278 TaxID=3346417 RepID=UPI0036D8B337
MPEPITMSLLWLGQAAGAAIVGRLAERGMDRLLDGPRQVVVPPLPPRAEPRRHRLGDVTSDLDITVRHTPAGRRPVLLAFQTAPREGERTAGVTVPMVLGETAHLTLPRDDYLISALVLDPPAELGGKPVLHGIGWVRHWVASSGTDRLTIATEVPRKKLLRKLGLQAPDGTSPFELPPPSAAALGQLPAAPAPLPGAQLMPRAIPKRFTPIGTAGLQRQCRAADLSRFGPRCTSLAVALGGNGLCVTHSLALTRGRPVYEWSTRQPIT